MNRTAGIAVLLLVGCVSQAKYDDLKQRYDDAAQQLGQRQQRIGSLGASLQDARAEIDLRKQENARAQVELTTLDRERQRLTAEQQRLLTQLTAALADRQRLTDSTNVLQSALGEIAKRKTEADRRVAEFKKLLARFKDLIDAGTLKLVIADGRMVLQMPSDVLFESGSARLSKAGKATIAEVAGVLKEEPGRRYQVEGHTDNKPIHNEAYASNWELASARGIGVMRALIDGGVETMALSAASYGEFHPVANNETEAGRAENRRIEIIVLPDLSLLPGYDELRAAVQPS
jgi:chemotaxis protein MotB